MLNKLKTLFKKPEPLVPQEEPKASVPENLPPENTETEVKKPKSTKSAKSGQSKPRKKKENSPSVLSPKEQATLAGEPYVSIISVDVDPKNVNQGSFELDFNDKFVINLIKAGYKIREDDTDVQIVDRWFQIVCRNVALEYYEQQQADPSKREYEDIRRVYTRDIGNGRTEVS